MTAWIRLLVVTAALVIAVTQSVAEEFGVYEVRAGFHAHSIDEAGSNGKEPNFANWEDASFDVLFRSPDIDAFRWIGSPKPNLGATVNLVGRESMVHLGLTWQLPIFDTPLFIEGTFGAAVHNGALTGTKMPLRNLGCSLLFYQGAGIGAKVGENMSVMLAWEHASSANICSPNRGLTNAGVKVGYRF